MTEPNSSSKPLDAARFGRVAVLMGGCSSEREISLCSGEAVVQALKHLKIEVTPVDFQRLDEKLFAQLKTCDRVFIALHGSLGEDGCVQGLLETMGIPYTGSGVSASAFAMDKYKSKQVWCAQGLATPPGWLLQTQTQVTEFLAKVDQGQVKLPLVVKPLAAGSSLGMSKVTEVAALKKALEEAFQFDSAILVEQFLSGAEYTVGILKDQVLPVVEIKTKNPFYDYAAKYEDKQTAFVVPAPLSAPRTKQIQALAWQAYQALGCQGWGRVDIICDDAGDFSLIEVNTIPGLTSHSLVPKACAAAEISFEQMVLQILDTATLAAIPSNPRAETP